MHNYEIIEGIQQQRQYSFSIRSIIAQPYALGSDLFIFTLVEENYVFLLEMALIDVISSLIRKSSFLGHKTNDFSDKSTTSRVIISE